MKTAYAVFNIEVPLNVTGDTNTGNRIEAIKTELEEYLTPLDAEVLSHIIINKDIVYRNFRGKGFTSDQILNLINSWMAMNEPFASMKGTMYNLAREEIFHNILSLLDGRDPSAIPEVLDPDHVITVMDSINRRLDIILAREEV